MFFIGISESQLYPDALKMIAEAESANHKSLHTGGLPAGPWNLPSNVELPVPL